MGKVAVLQVAPVLLDAAKTWARIKAAIEEAAGNGAELVAFGETLLPGYPVWLSPANGAAFDNAKNKRTFAKYHAESIRIDTVPGEDEDPILKDMRATAKAHKVVIVGGVAEKFGGTIYCTLLTISADGEVLGRHRKLKPTYEERLVWGDGDGGRHIKVHKTAVGRVGSLNCWENWIPTARAALHQQQEEVHVAVWPGALSLTKDISRFMALEGRSWILSASGVLRPKDVAHLDEDEFPVKSMLLDGAGEWFYDGGSMIVNPRGQVVAGPLLEAEGILYADIDLGMVYEERNNFDYSGHYSRHGVLQLKVTDGQ